MDLLDLFLAVSTAAVVVAALLFPINRDEQSGERKRAPEDSAENIRNKDDSGER